MGELFVTLVLGSAVFVPLLIISIVRFESVAIAFAVAATFSVGAMVGFFLCLLLAGLVIPRHSDDTGSLLLTFLFASGGAIGGAAIALSLLRKMAGDQPWRRR
jgi:predicted permease